MKKDFTYIIKKILIGVGIFLVISFIKSCDVHALSYSLENVNTRLNMYGTYVNNIQWGTNYWRGVSYEQYTGFDSKVEIIGNENFQLEQGRYLISFVLFSNQNQNDLTCSNITSNFKNVNVTTGQWVQNEISSKCYDVYKTIYNGKPAWRLLYDFTYKSNRQDLNNIIFELEFIVTSNNGYKFFQGDQNGLDIGLDISDIQDYDISIINTWNNDKQNQTIISNGNTLINQNQTIINQNTQINNSINSVNDSINDSSTASNQDFNNAIDSVKNSLPTNSTISSLITMPITFLQKIIDALNGTCTPITIGELYEYNMTMPCINPSDYIGIIWNIIDVICSGFFAYYFGKKLVLLFHNITSMKEGGLKEAYD